MIIAGTGHRPDKLGGYDPSAQILVYHTAVEALTQLATVDPDETTTIISGMALGWDTALAQAALQLKLPLVCAVPFQGQEKKWPDRAQDLYHRILKQAQDVVIVSPGGYENWKMGRRNEYMVNSCDRVLALWNGSFGGTRNCVVYAEKQGKPITNCWELFTDIKERHR